MLSPRTGHPHAPRCRSKATCKNAAAAEVPAPTRFRSGRAFSSASRSSVFNCASRASAPRPAAPQGAAGARGAGRHGGRGRTRADTGGSRDAGRGA